MDCGSKRSYLTARLAKKLCLETNQNDLLMIFTFDSDKAKEISSPVAEVFIITKRGCERNIVPTITERILVPELDLPDVVDIFADDKSQGDSIDLLIGNELYFSFLRNQYTRINEQLYLID